MTDATQFAEIRNELEIYNLPVDEWSAALTAINGTGSYTKKDGTVLGAPFKPDDIQKFKDGSDPWGHPNTDWYKSTLKDWSLNNVIISRLMEEQKMLNIYCHWVTKIKMLITKILQPVTNSMIYVLTLTQT
ncbi:hypothetical protein KUH03_38715 [Sphingobacterium sp. E70]|uniref:hypothetical protein n=1 Tax=Sphingobacterium sp. E70 TaxID=2853439 RepID=UPI00211CA6CC|nr:hypothetical protein [Sphingobacterium sp. E70]ULT24770.1 hypothetical protein KUH03_38715 [Sphingobacterium sp. E70]